MQETAVRRGEDALESWTEARFPNSVMRAEFLDQIRLWNRIEDLPHIEARLAADGTSLRYNCADYRREGLRKLVDSYGGSVRFEPRYLGRIDVDCAAAFERC